MCCAVAPVKEDSLRQPVQEGVDVYGWSCTRLHDLAPDLHQVVEAGADDVCERVLRYE